MVNVSLGEAEWTLKIVERRFDSFIVMPARDRAMREWFDKKIKDANRRPIGPAREDGSSWSLLQTSRHLTHPFDARPRIGVPDGRNPQQERSRRPDSNRGPFITRECLFWKRQDTAA
jgi:hypothetical protein